MFKKMLAIVGLFFSHISLSQNTVDSLLKLGNKFYNKKDFASAASSWAEAGKLAKYNLQKGEYYVYSALAYAKAADSANGIKYLQLAIRNYAYNDLAIFQSEEFAPILKADAKWGELVASIKPSYTTNPRKAKFIDSDVKNFWDAYDSVLKAPERGEAIFDALYFEKGTNAMQFYYLDKIRSTGKFVNKQKRLKKYFESIRANTLKATELKRQYVKSFVRLKKIYPKAIFPNTYFVIGSISSGGTVSNDGLILGIDQAVMSPEVDTTGLTLWEYNNISKFKNLPHTVAHELIHFQQNGMAADTSLLSAAIKEGMADFIGELISGKTSNERLFVYAKGKEKRIWEDFKKEMYLNRAKNWIANSNQETAEKPADLGYWVGYKICKAYYEEAKNKKKAIDDMLHIKDYKQFLVNSRLDEKIQ